MARSRPAPRRGLSGIDRGQQGHVATGLGAGRARTGRQATAAGRQGGPGTSSHFRGQGCIIAQ
jgi:hypothetical protein